MYHHRYQPQASHLANRNTSAFASNNHHSSSASASKANNQVSAEAAGQRNIVTSNSSSAPHNNNSFNFGNHNKPGTNSVYHSGAYSSQPRQFAEERQDVIFRRVRGILNKITPETFDKLSKELVNVGLDSPRTLRGLIYLLFDKALKDLKYSSLYAKLCQQLSEKAPNFEQERGPNTFCKFLISKCEDEFERRRKATEDFDGKNELTDEEFEQKAIAKQKMLGNIKFICELGKKRLLQEEILHECIRGLLSKKKERPIQDQAQDLECLCQIMRTIGSLLDIQASRNLMNQYFERIDMYSKKPELPSRIRFMLRDVIDLRNNKWRPRPFQREDNVPQPLSRLREEAGFNNSSTNTSIDNIGNTKNLMSTSDLSKMHGSKVSSLLIDDDGPSFTTTTDFHWGSNTFLPNETEFDIFSSNMPSCNKLGSSTNAPGTIRANSTSLSTNTNSTASVSKHTSNQMTPVSQVKHEAYVNNNNNNGMSNIHNRIDPFSDSFKTNKFGQNNRIPMQRENIFGMHGNQDMDRHTDGTHGFGRRNLAREPLLPPPQSAPALVKPKDINLATTRPNREAPSAGQARGNPIIHSNAPLGHRGPPARDDNPNHISRRPIVDSPRPPPHRRGGDTSPAPRFANPQRHLDDMPPPPPPPTEQNVSQHPRQQQNPPRNSRQGMEADHRPEQRFPHGVTNGNQGMRGRRYDRNEDRFDNESREPKFSGTNYRLPGRENRQPPRDQQNFNRANHQPAVSRPREDVERRNFRPAFGRNQSFDAQNTIDSNRDHDWRKETPPIPVKKEQVPSTSSLVSSPLLTKPAIRTSESDFSLRPSHNLGARAYPETQTQTAAKLTEANPSVTNNNVNSDSRFGIRPQLDVTPIANKNIDNKETEKMDASTDENSKCATKEFYVSKFNSLISQHSSDIPKIASKMKELKIPKIYHSECLISAMKQSIIGSESDRENTSKLLVSLVPSIVDPSSLLSAFRVIFEQLNALEAETPKVKSLVAEFLSRAVFDGLLALEEVGGVLVGGKHHPLFLLLLQKLEKKGGQAWLVEKFLASKINLMDMLPEADRSEDRLATALKDRCLGFLDPMLTIEPDLWAQMMRDPSPAAIYRWIKENVDQTIQSTPTFAHVLIACMLKYINNITSEQFKGTNNDHQQKDLESDDSTKSSPTNPSSQGLIDLEKELLSKYQQILQAFLKDKQMQLATLYALQSFYHGLDFPKGALLRWFHMLYDLSIVDDEVFFIWKEEINDEFPGKGQALFQVNTWLNWLAEPESEDEDEV